jgi:antitoxin (DNA-binding transcriptional repressor) of toxin-antitoxin stability system
MKTITLRTLVREPLKVKRLTRAGQSITVTDHGNPLWVIRPAGGPETSDAEVVRRKAIDEILDEVLLEKPARVSAVELLEASRR